MNRSISWKEKMIDRYQKRSVIHKLSLLFIALVTIVLLVSFLLIFLFIYQSSSKRYEAVLDSQVDNIITQTQGMLETIDGNLILIAPDETVQKILMAGEQLSAEKQYENKIVMRNVLGYIASANQNIAMIEVEDLHGRSYYSSLWDDASIPEYQNLVLPTDITEQSVKIAQDTVIELPDGLMLDRAIVVHYNIYDRGTGNHIGYLNILLNDAVLTEYLESFLLHQQDVAMITAGKQQIVVAANGAEAALDCLQNIPFDTWQGQADAQMGYTEGHIWEKKAIDQAWSIQYGMSLISLQQELRFSALIFLILFGVTAVSGSALMRSMMQSFMNPLLQLGQAMTQHTGQDMQHVHVKNQDEIGLLVYHYNSMVDKNKALLDQVVKEQKERRRYEYMSLQAQINPHFLYNTLETICGLADAKQNDLIIEIVSALADFYRTTLNEGHSTLTIRKELEVTERYLEILSIRYQGGFSYKIDVDPHLLECNCVKLLLQPLVENAIQHGFNCQNTGETIYIKGELVGGKVHLTVHDNGRGITPEQMAEFNRGLQSTEKVGHFGLYSVQRRIQSYFGSSYGIHLAHAHPHGLAITLILPFQPRY